MDRPPLEVADLIRAAGNASIERSRKWITWKHVKVLLAIARCRTAMLGGHLDECTRCGHRAISYNSCRNRHCPKSQAGARERWLEKRRRGLAGLLETSIRRPGVCAPLSGPLHPSRSHFQSSTGLVCRAEGHLPLARLRSQKRTAPDDSLAR